MHRRTDAQTMSKLLHPPLTRGVKNGLCPLIHGVLVFCTHNLTCCIILVKSVLHSANCANSGGNNRLFYNLEEVDNCYVKSDIINDKNNGHSRKQDVFLDLGYPLPLISMVNLVYQLPTSPKL